MATDDKDLRPEEVEINKILRDGTARIAEIDELIKNPPNHSSPSLTPGPEYFTRHSQESVAHYRRTMEYEKERVKADTKERAVKCVEKSPLELQLSAYDKIDKWAEPNGDKRKNLEDRIEKEKDLSYSQDAAMRMMSESRTGAKEENEPNITTQSGDEGQRTQNETRKHSMNMRFSTTLSYNDLDSKSEPDLDEPERDPD